MNNTEFEQIVDKTIKTTANDVTSATDVSKRETAVKNFKTVSDILLEHRKLEYSHEENQKRIENESAKIEDERKRFNTEMELKYAQLDSDARKQKTETIVKCCLQAGRVALLIFAMANTFSFETGNAVTSSLKSMFSSFGRTIADDAFKTL